MHSILYCFPCEVDPARHYLAFCNYESIRHRNSGLPAGHADDWSLGATLEGVGGFSSGGQKLE